MIELVVAFVLVALLLSIASTSLVRAFDGSDRALESQRLRTQFDQARTMLAADLRSARAPGRDFEDVRDLTALRAEIANGTNALPDSLDLQDVKAASATQLTFVGDAVSDPIGGTMSGVECISWRVRTIAAGTSPSWVLERGVAPYSSTCPAGAPWQWATWVGPILVPDVASAPTAAFRRYQLTCNPSVCGTGTGGGPGKGKAKGKKTTVTTTGAGGCGDPDLVDSVTDPLEIGWITSVDLDLGSVAVRRDSSQREAMRASIALRNRLSDDYRFALGCTQ